MKPKFRKQNRGFTLVEMLVSLSLFAVVITMSVGTLLVLIDANGRAQSMQLVMTNLSFSLDSMTREIRTGFNWFCDSYTGDPDALSIPTSDGDSTNSVRDCPSGNYFSIVESGSSLTDNLAACSLDPLSCSRRVTYLFDDDYYFGETGVTKHGAILRLLGDGVDSGTEGGVWVPLTGPDVSIDAMDIVVQGTERWSTNYNGLPGSGDTIQPNATFFIKGRAGFNATGNTAKVKVFSIQTSISQMLLDI